MIAEPPATLLARATTTLVRYPRFNELHEDIALCQRMSQLAGEPQCMALEGLTGTGKSTLVRTYAEAFSRYETPSGTRVPVFYMETPSPVTVKGMAARMLEVLGDPAAHKGPLWSMNARLVHFVQACAVQIIILDDFHHLIDRETNRILETVSEWLKVLIKETNVPFLVVGLEGRVEQILQANKQLSRLFAVRETLTPFRWDPTDEGSMQEFAAFVTYAEQGIGLPLSDELPRLELLQRLHYATDGVVGNLMNLLRFAALLAPLQGTTSLTLALLHRSFGKRLRQHMMGKANPFNANSPLVASPAAPVEPPHATSRRSHRRREQGPLPTEVLKTG